MKKFLNAFIASIWIIFFLQSTTVVAGSKEDRQDRNQDKEVLSQLRKDSADKSDQKSTYKQDKPSTDKSSSDDVSKVSPSKDIDPHTPNAPSGIGY